MQIQEDPVLLEAQQKVIEIINTENKYFQHMEKFGVKMISMSDIEIQSQLGSGAYGDVYKGIYKAVPVAVKVLKNLSQQDLEKAVEDFFNDITPQCKLRHHRFVTLYGISYDKGLAIVSELCKEDCKNALQRLLQPGNERLKLRISYELAEALFIMHEMYNLVHRDIKCLNVLLDKNDHVKVCDLGLARNLVATLKAGQKQIQSSQSSQQSSMQANISQESIYIEVEKFQRLEDATLRFMAPEYFKSKAVLTKAVDTWSYGCTLLQL